jgi:hypothetical protein
MICRSGGYTASIRPPGRVTDPQKRALMAAYDDTEALGNVETDHIVSLSFGGVPNDPANLYPGPNYPDVSLGGLVRRDDGTFVRSGRRAHDSRYSEESACESYTAQPADQIVMHTP